MSEIELRDAIRILRPGKGKKPVKRVVYRRKKGQSKAVRHIGGYTLKNGVPVDVPDHVVEDLMRLPGHDFGVSPVPVGLRPSRKARACAVFAANGEIVCKQTPSYLSGEAIKDLTGRGYKLFAWRGYPYPTYTSMDELREMDFDTPKVISLVRLVHKNRWYPPTECFRFRIGKRGPIICKGQPTYITADQFKKFIVRYSCGALCNVREATDDDLTLIPSRPEYNDSFTEGDVTVIIPCYKNLPMARSTIESFRKFYSTVPIVLVDDTAQFGDGSIARYLLSLRESDPNVTVVIHEKNITHGPSLNHGIQFVKTKRFFTMDADVITERGGFLELMESRMIEKGLFAIGQMHFSTPNGAIHPYAGLWDTDVYRSLPPFSKASLPDTRTTVSAYKSGMDVEDFPIWEYVNHVGGGNRALHGGAWNPYRGTHK